MGNIQQALVTAISIVIIGLAYIFRDAIRRLIFGALDKRDSVRMNKLRIKVKVIEIFAEAFSETLLEKPKNNKNIESTILWLSNMDPLLGKRLREFYSSWTTTYRIYNNQGFYRYESDSIKMNLMEKSALHAKDVAEQIQDKLRKWQ